MGLWVLFAFRVSFLKGAFGSVLLRFFSYLVFALGKLLLDKGLLYSFYGFPMVFLGSVCSLRDFLVYRWPALIIIDMGILWTGARLRCDSLMTRAPILELIFMEAPGIHRGFLVFFEVVAFFSDFGGFCP